MDFNILLLILALAAAGYASTEPSECKGLTCPNLAQIKLDCPEDSYSDILQPPHISPPADLRVLAKRSLVQYHKRESIKIVPGHISRRSVPYEPPPAAEHNTTLFGLCCPQKVCLCSQCTEPTCVRADMVPLVKFQGSQRPGNCCATYTCKQPPNCARLETGFEWKEYCKRCRCEAGVGVCHEEEECRTSTTASSAGRALSCYSEPLGRNFPVFAQWMENECTHCVCTIEGERICTVSSCRGVTMCPKPVTLPGECCPTCDIRDTHFCEGHEKCPIVCKNGYQRDNSSDCNLCLCAVGVPSPAASTPSATATPEEDPGNSQMIFIIIACCVIALGLLAGVIWYFWWRPEKKSYETVSTVDSRQSSEAKGNGVISGMPFNCDILSIKMDVDGDTLKKRDQNGALTNQHNYS
uniref:Putative cell wall integrity and stress response component 4-like protein n=1 Tax=Phlebotomus kandelakii TaxID=1109342 RepID=A0A6B2E6N2_9DIPT